MPATTQTSDRVTARRRLDREDTTEAAETAVMALICVDA